MSTLIDSFGTGNYEIIINIVLVEVNLGGSSPVLSFCWILFLV